MTDRLLFDLPFPAPAVIPPFSPVPPLHDESLFLDASARWRESSQGLPKLVDTGPGIRDTLDQMLKQQLDLDGQQAGLLFAATNEQSEHFVSFTQACAFVLQHPTLEPDLDRRCRVAGLNQIHPLSTLPPLQMLERLKALKPVESHGERWRTFWDTRAPGTAISRRARAVQLYRNHFEAAAQLALARKTLTAEQFKPLQLLIDPPVGALTLNDQPIHTEQLALVLSNHSRVKLTGAWVITTGVAADVSQLLYLPSRPVAIQRFNQRSDMEDWLSRQALVPTGLPTDNIRFEYTAATDPMVVGSSDLFAAHQQAQISALLHGTRGKPGLAMHGAQSLVQADQIGRDRNKVTVFASPPRLEVAENNTEADRASLFGNLYADIPWSLRQAALKKQRDALETLVKKVGVGEGLQPFKDSIDTLETAEQDADKAASALLERSRTLEPVAFQRELTALHNAHKAGLHAEAALQLALEQLSDDECNLLKALLDTPDDPGPDPVAAGLTLSMSKQDGDKTTVTTQEFNGAFIITRGDALGDPDSPHSMLLYLSGTGGGLQRFANRRELERQVFKVHDRDGELTVQLKKITGDALQYGLNQLSSEFEGQADALRQRHSEPDQAAQLAEQLDILRKRALATLQVPVHAARSLAFTHVLEQNRSGTLASNLPDWLRTLKETDRGRLKKLIAAYILAMRQSHKLMTIALEPRDDYTRKHLHARLSKDFSLKGHFDVHVNLPDSVTWETQHSSGPSGPQRTSVMVPSTTYSKMSLADLGQLNIDPLKSVQQDPLSQRLVFMRLEVTATDSAERFRLLNGINLQYLRKTLPELDLPKTYEQLIRDAFQGGLSESAFVKEHRRESLIEPWRLMLKLQGECAHQQKQLNDDQLKVLNIAIDANTPEAWDADGQRIVILAVDLSVGGKDTPNQLGVTLSGVTLIEEQISGKFLLYLPDSPDGQFLHRFNSRAEACERLFKLCVHDKWVSYLAGRALKGDVRAHESRIKQAVLNDFKTLFEVGERWTPTTSLAAHLLNAHMGRLIEAHRDTSRSNDALYFERHALSGPRAFNYIKMAMGVVPFVGTVLSLYDAWTAANRATAAFLRGDVGDGLTEVESMLLSLVDALMDLLPGEAITGVLSRTARSLTRTRQAHKLLRNVAAMHGISQRQARHVVKRFIGYEYEKPMSLTGVQPATHGIYRGIYRHADGDFIERQGRIFQVELSKDSRNWRLFGNSRKTYKQPIALDETGHWDTWYGVYGTTFEGGGLGGGQVFGLLADAFDPIWPQVIRQRLPRYLTDATYRRIEQLKATIEDLGNRFDTQRLRTDAALERFRNGQKEMLPKLEQTAEAACKADIDLGIRRYEAAVELQRLNGLDTKGAQTECTWMLADRFKIRLHLTGSRITSLVDEAEQLSKRLDELPEGALDQYLSLMENLRQVRVKIVSGMDQMDEFMDKMNRWFHATPPPPKNKKNPTKDQITFDALRKEIEFLNQQLSTFKVLVVKTGHLMEIVKRVGTTSDMSWIDLQKQTRSLREKFDRALFTHHSLGEINTTRTQRNQILQDCLEIYTQLRRGMRAWTASYPQHFHLEAVEPLLTNIEKMAERARKAIGKATVDKPTGQGDKKVFTTEDDQLLIGTEQWEKTTQTRQYVLTGTGGAEEIWEQASNGKFRLLNPQDTVSTPPQRNLAAVLADAQQRLDAQPTYQAKVQSYADQDMLPVDLQHMMDSEADELTRRALRLEEMDAQNPLIQQLRDKAIELTATGRAMRTRQTLSTKKPTDGMLEDLLKQKVVKIFKNSPLKNLGKRKDGRTDYMQEYEVWTDSPEKLLWYAHFHYSSAKPVMRQFEKAHLKLPEHRFLTHADDANLPYADVGKQSGVVADFEEAKPKVDL